LAPHWVPLCLPRPVPTKRPNAAPRLPLLALPTHGPRLLTPSPPPKKPPRRQVIKIKPPMVFSATDADLLADTLGALLAERAASAPLRAKLAAADAARVTSHVAPLAAAYAENAARIYAHAAAAAAGGAGASAGSACSSEVGSSPRRGAAPAAAASGKRPRGGAGIGGVGAGSLLRRVISWASFRSDSSSLSSAGEWELPAAPDSMGRPATGAPVAAARATAA
jgi:hypothetical protein